ncbi:DUF3822 family protein [Vicingaceae bacterium]|nr:DUF3822 family protein [Vicingaceae bacterium]MDB4060779.1 DUF3822 family protein [Vicingaceae bacterium]
MNQSQPGTGKQNMALTPIPQLRFFDERYVGKTTQLKHFVVLSKLQLKSAFFDDQSQTYISYEQYDFKKSVDWVEALRSVEKILPSEAFQLQKGLQICLSNSLYTLVPNVLFDEKELESYLNFNHPIEDQSQFIFHHTPLESFDAVVVFAIPRGLEFLLKAKLPPHQLLHFSYPILEAVGLNKMKENELLINVQQEQFEIIYAPNGKLNFFNSFQYQSKEDFIYFLLYVMEHLKLERDNCKLILVGEIEKDSAIYKLLYTYIDKVSFGQKPSNIHFSAVLGELNDYSNFSLFHQHLCG